MKKNTQIFIEKTKSHLAKVLAGLTVTGVVWWIKENSSIDLFSQFKDWVSWIAILTTGLGITFLLFKIKFFELTFFLRLKHFAKTYWKWFVLPVLLFAFYFGLKSYVSFKLSSKINDRMDLYQEDLDFIYNTVLPCGCEIIKMIDSHPKLKTEVEGDSLYMVYLGNILVKKLNTIVSEASPYDDNSTLLLKSIKFLSVKYQKFKVEYEQGELSYDEFLQKIEGVFDNYLKPSFEYYSNSTLKPVTLGVINTFDKDSFDSNKTFKIFSFIETIIKDFENKGRFKSKLSDRKAKIVLNSYLSVIIKRGKNYERFMPYLDSDCIPKAIKLFDEQK